MAIRLQGFGGEIPKTEPHYLPETAASAVLNAALDRGSLTAFRQASAQSHLFGSNMAGIYLHNASWMGWDHDVDVVPGPVAQDRLYITHSNAPPTIWTSGTGEFPLRLPNPTTKPTVALVGALDETLAETVIYAFTWVTSLGEESGPSPLSDPLQWSPGRSVNITSLPITAPVAGRQINGKRIYRALTSASGATELLYVGQTTVAASSWVHNPATNPDAEAITTKEFDPAPDNLRGLTAMPGGMMAGFAGKELYFCEPYQPHAWPGAYVLTTNDTIIGLAAFGTTLAVLTTGVPYLVQGMHPDQMAMSKMEQPFPCMSKRSIVDMGYAAIYASTDGLVQVSESGAQLMSAQLWTREQWRAMLPTTMMAARFGSRYGFTWATPVADDRQITLVDAGEGGASVLRADYEPYAFHTHVESGQTFFLASNLRTVRAFDDPALPRMTYLWRGRPLRFEHDMGFGAIRIDADMSDGATMACRLYADDAEVALVTTANVPVRLPAGKARAWQVQVTGTARVFRVVVARTLRELNG